MSIWLGIRLTKSATCDQAGEASESFGTTPTLAPPGPPSPPQTYHLHEMISRHNQSIWWSLALLLILCQCQTQHDRSDALFQLLDSDYTGIDFQNTITPDEELNLLNFEYMYNGGGVGVGDFDQNGLPDLVFTGNQVKSRIYLNQGDLQFEDITDRSGFDTQGHWCTGVSIVDINSDGYDDIYVCVGGPGQKSTYPNLLFINQGDLTFKESAAAYGLADPNESNQAAFFDYDLDGDLDMYLLNGGGFEKSAVTIRPILKDGSGRNTDRLYQNNLDEAVGHPIFTDVSDQAGITIEGFGLGVGIIDANTDGWPDVYVSNDYLSRDLLYINNQNGTFAEAAEQYFNHMSHFSMGNDIGDINNDGNLDIITLDMLPESHYRRKMMFGPNQYDRFYQAVKYDYGFQYMRNMLHVGKSDKGFRELGQLAGIERTDWSWAPLIADFDNDGLQDIYITNGYGKDITDLDFVKFRKDAITPFSNPEEVRQRLIKSLDDRPSITLPNYVYKNNGNHTFKNTTDEWGVEQPSISTGAAYVDLDQDGDLELITNNIDQNAFIYKNNLHEKDSTTAHYLKVKLVGSKYNRSGVGSTIATQSGQHKHLRYVQPVKGFQSSVTDVIHFGLGEQTSVDQLEITWPDGKKSILKAISANQAISVNYSDATTVNPQPEQPVSFLQKKEDIKFKHKEPEFANDFKSQPLLLHGFTNQGPGMAVGDVNGDGLDDLFIGGSYGQAASLFLQMNNSSFVERAIPTENYEDLGALLLDIDNDQDLDLYVTSGGSERYPEHQYYQDRIYVNDGTGNFTYDDLALPAMLTSTSAVVGTDYDQDGDVDLFVGGRVVPGSFPVAPQSYLLENTGGKFKDVTMEVCPELKSIGMVTSAIWTDFNNDHSQDLIVVGEMMKISLFQNDGKTLQNITDQAGLEQSSGMWNSIAAGDFDKDGDMDYVVGNTGQNTSFEVSQEHPLKLHFADFDQNGSVDPIYSLYEEDAYHPVASLDLLTQQLPEIKKKFLHYKNYAQSTTGDILDLLDVSEMQTLKCENQSSILLENRGDSQFSMKPLPLMAQVAPVKGILTEDFNLDGLLDLLLVGNDYNTEVVSGKYDASTGTVLINEGNLTFSVLEAEESGLNTTGDTRSAVKLALGNDKLLFLISNNNGPLESYAFAKKSQSRLFAFQGDEVSAVIEYQDGKEQKIEYHLGSGYLSQSSGIIRLSPQAKKVYFKNSTGQQTRQIDLAEIEENI